jgi:predicted amidohydrolase YtcJ
MPVARLRLYRIAIFASCLIATSGAFQSTVRAAAADGEIILYHAHIFTADTERPYADAVAIRGDRIVAVGTLTNVATAVSPSAKRVDLGGKFLMPGMIDAHAHPIAGGEVLGSARYSASDVSVPNLVKFVEATEGKKSTYRGDVLVIEDLDLPIWSHSAEIDAALSQGKFAKQRIVLVGSDGHTAWGNRAAREKSGITRKFLQGLSKEGQHYYGHDDQLNPNGFVVDAGKTKLYSTIPQPSADVELQAGRAALDYMHSNGITGWLDAAAAGVVGGSVPLSSKDPGFLPVYEALGKAGELTAHIVAYPVVQPDLGFGQIDIVQALQARFKDIPNFRIPGLKVFADGVVENPSQTASLTRPYKNSGVAVAPLFTPSKMNALVVEAYRRGLTVHVHAIGDLAVKDTLDAFEAARKANPTTTLPFVMTHLQFVDPEDVPRFAQLRVIGAVQLLWALADPSTNELVKPYIDESIWRQMYVARSLLESGAELAGASDWPVSSANPFAAMYQAETRRGPQGVLLESERVPRIAMLYAYTNGSADAIDMSKEVGSISPNKLADLVLVDRDVLTVPAEELKEAKVLWTLFGGKVVYGQSPF